VIILQRALDSGGCMVDVSLTEDQPEWLVEKIASAEMV
jgi:hypothetical protein